MENIQIIENRCHKKILQKTEILQQYYICITFWAKVLILDKKTYRIKSEIRIKEKNQGARKCKIV